MHPHPGDHHFPSPDEFATQDFLRSFIDTVREPLLALDAALCVRFANHSFLRSFGVSPGEIEGRPIYELGNRQWDIPKLRSLLEDILASESAFYDFEVEHDFEQIGRRTMLLNARRIERPDGEQGLILLAIEDVTERVQASRKITEYESQFRLIFESVKDFAIFATDTEGMITSWNAGAENLFGFQEGEAIGRSFAIVFTPEDRDDDVPRRELESASRIGRGSDERWHIRKDGSRFFASGVVTRLAADSGRLIGFTKICRDVTLQAREGEASRMLAAIVASSDDAIIAKDLDGNIVSWNGAAERIFGYSPGEIVGRHISILVPPGHGDEVSNILDRVRRGERVEHFETRRRTKDGRILDLSISISPIRDAGGRIVGASKVARDVTEQKRIVRAVRESEALKGAILASALDCVITIDAGGRVREWNPAAEATFGYTRGEALGSTVADLIVPPELRDMHRRGLARYLETGEGPVLNTRVEVPALRRDGSIFPVELSIVPIRLEQATVFTAYARDITERKTAEEALRKSEDRYRQLAGNVQQLFWSCLPDGECDYLSRQWVDYTGIPESDQLGLRWLELVIHPDDRRRTLQIWTDAVHDRGAYDLEYRIRGADGAYRWFKTRGTAIRDESGRIVKWFGTCTDIDAQKAAEEAAEASRAEAELANRMKDEFLAILSHELRTPLNAIVGWAKILRSGKVDAEDMREGLDVIERNGHVQSQLIEDLLDVSRITTGNLRLDVQRLSVADVIEAAIAAVGPAAVAKEIRLVKTLDSLVGPVTGDFARLQQIVWNLLSNAVKFTPKGGKVQVLLERVNSHIEISVIDTGMGIRPDFLPQVFDRFRQADSSSTRRHGGLGLGLSIVKHLVEMHGGSIRAKSPGEGQGATFTVMLPITVVHPEQPEPYRVSPKAEESKEDLCQDGALAGLRVLVVDDEPDARNLIRRVLVDCEADVVMAESATEALLKLDQFRPDVIVSDIGMPDQDGYDLILKVRETYSAKEIPAVALTAFARPQDRRRALIAGFQTHVAKPVDPAELTAVVASLAGRTGRRDEHQGGRR